MIQIRRNPTDKLLELGGGANPIVHPMCKGGRDVNVDVRMCYDAQNNPTVDFTANFDEPLPISSDEFDAVVSHFAIEHVTWRKLPQFVSEMFRVVKPGGKAIVISPNTEAQIEWIKNNPNGWDEKDIFDSASCILYGDQDYSDNTHKAFMSPTIAMKLFQDAGFQNIIISPYGARDTDMSIVADKVGTTAPAQHQAIAERPKPNVPMIHMSRNEMFDKNYFHGGAKVGGYANEGYWDYPVHNVTAAHIMLRKPKSVLEIGCVLPGTPIITDNGVVAIENMEPGQRVYTHKGRFSRMTQLSTRQYDGTVVKLESRYSQCLPLVLTEEHPVFVVPIKLKYKGWKPLVDGPPMWVEAGKLDPNKYWLAIPRPKRTMKEDIEPNFARLCGYYLSEGWTWEGENQHGSRVAGVSFCFHKKEKEYIQDVQFLMKRYFNTTDGWFEKSGKNATKICFYTREGCDKLVSLFGKGARDKSIPNSWIMGASDESLQQLVVGMYNGDGTKPNKWGLCYNTSSIAMAIGLRLILLRLGIVAGIAKMPAYEGKIGTRTISVSDGYRIATSGTNDKLFSDLLGYPHTPRKTKKTFTFGSIDGDYAYIPIKRMEKMGYCGPVFNMDVEEDNSYSHPAVTIHNCARGYILKRLQDNGIVTHGLEISKHCNMTRVCDPITMWDSCDTPWPFHNMEAKFGLCYSIAVLEHIPEEFVPSIIKEMARVSERGLHGIDFGEKDDGFDKTHFTLRSKEWWEQMFATHAPGWPVEIVNKEDLERGNQPFDTFLDDGLIKLNVGCYINQFHHNWINLDVHDLNQFAQANGYRYQQCDVKNGLPFATGTVSCIYSSHMLEHLTYDEGLAFLRECRRVIKPDGLIRILVPDAGKLIGLYDDVKDVGDPSYSDLAEISGGVENAPTDLRKTWELLMAGHQSAYDGDTLRHAFESVGFKYQQVTFRHTTHEKLGKKMLTETMDMLPCISLIAEGTV